MHRRHRHADNVVESLLRIGQGPDPTSVSECLCNGGGDLDRWRSDHESGANAGLLPCRQKLSHIVTQPLPAPPSPIRVDFADAPDN